ncbi:MAG: HAD-IC family P-type ATPase, partial [Oscillospiraceae bacterium]
SEVLPGDKADVVKKLQKEGKKVMMVGDGINDAPALTQADTGVAIGNGSDIAIESGEVILMKSDLRDVVKSIRLSRLTIKNVKQNLFWAFFYNIIGIPIAAGALYLINGTLLSPMIGGFAMSFSSVFVVGNALRLKTKKL